MKFYKKCNLCQDELPDDKFSRYTYKGVVKLRPRCRQCVSDKQTARNRAEQNRALSRLLAWPAP